MRFRGECLRPRPLRKELDRAPALHLLLILPGFLVLSGHLCSTTRCNVVHIVSHIIDHSLQHDSLLRLIFTGVGEAGFLQRVCLLFDLRAAHMLNFSELALLDLRLDVLDLVERELLEDGRRAYRWSRPLAHSNLAFLSLERLNT